MVRVKIKDLNKGIKTKVIQAKTHFICHVKIKDLNKGIKTKVQDKKYLYNRVLS